jgi:hypothetical protein
MAVHLLTHSLAYEATVDRRAPEDPRVSVGNERLPTLGVAIVNQQAGTVVMVVDSS